MVNPFLSPSIFFVEVEEIYNKLGTKVALFHNLWEVVFIACVVFLYHIKHNGQCQSQSSASLCGCLGVCVCVDVWVGVWVGGWGGESSGSKLVTLWLKGNSYALC